jgi:hypothetical protein
MTLILATDWNEVTAFATIALVIAAVVAAVLAKRDIDIQLDASKAAQEGARVAQDIAKRQLEAQLVTSAEELQAAQEGTRTAQETAQQQLDAQLRTSAEDLRAAQEATRTAQETAQHQIEASYRPLLIDVSEHMPKDSDLDPSNEVLLQFANGHDVTQDWRKVYVGFPDACVSVAVPLRNVGAGPAVIDKKGVRVIGDGVDREILGSEVHRERVPPTETTRILCTHGRVPDSYPNDLQVLVPYCDFAGEQAVVADVRLERVEQDHWRVSSITPLAPENIATRADRTADDAPGFRLRARDCLSPGMDSVQDD